jgi:transposase
MSSKKHRVTVAIKWHYLDGLSAPEIRDRMEAEGLGDYSESTIRRYLNEEPADEALQMIEEEHANTRLQIAEHEQQLFERARQAEFSATTDSDRVGMVPRTAQNDKEFPIEVDDWRELEVGDDGYPEWATGDDTIIEFTDGLRSIDPGERYPIQSVTGEPMYQTAVVGVDRDVPDESARQEFRYEQSTHLTKKGEVLGVYSDKIELDATVDSDLDVELDLEEKEQLDELFGGESRDGDRDQDDGDGNEGRA